MSQQIFSFIAALIFAVVAILHLWRILASWDIVIAGTSLPLSVSWVGLIITGVLAYCGLCLSVRKS